MYSFQSQFSRCQLMELYSAFIQNFMRAKAAVEVAKHSRPDFSKLLEVSVCAHVCMCVCTLCECVCVYMCV